MSETIGGEKPIPSPILAVVWTAITLLLGGVLAQLVRRSEPDVPVAHLTVSILATGGMTTLGLWKFGTSPEMLILSAFVVTITPLAIIDLRTSRLPNRLVALSYMVTAAAVVAATLWNGQLDDVVRPLLGAAALGLFYGVLYALMPGELGGGDVKLAGVPGLALGWQGVPAVIGGLLAIWLTGVVFYLIAIAIRGKLPPKGSPHGPALLLGALAAHFMHV